MRMSKHAVQRSPRSGSYSSPRMREPRALVVVAVDEGHAVPQRVALVLLLADLVLSPRVDVRVIEEDGDLQPVARIGPALRDLAPELRSSRERCVVKCSPLAPNWPAPEAGASPILSPASNPFATISSNIAPEHGAQQLCSSTGVPAPPGGMPELACGSG